MADVQFPSQPVDQSKATEIVVTAGGLPEPTPVAGQGEDTLTTYFRMRSRYILNEMILAAPRMDKPTNQPGFEFARVGPPNAALAVDWQSWRKGGRPIKPSPYLNQPWLGKRDEVLWATPQFSTDLNCVLMRQEQDFDNVELEGDDKGYFISAGTYYYAFRDRTAMTMSHPMPPFDTIDDASMCIVQANDYVPGILNAQWVNNASRAAVTQP